MMTRLFPNTVCFLAVAALVWFPGQANASVNPILPLGDINVLILTDTHSWVGGHGRQEPETNANYGDVLSFYQQLKEHCESEGHDLWFVNNGDWVDGTGLSKPGDPSSLVPLLEKMPWDAVNCGNHELYDPKVVEYMLRPGGFVDWWGDRYITSNVQTSDDKKPLGQPYKILKGHQGNLLVFGFLYDMDDQCDLITVEHVATVMTQTWFEHALKNENYDAILVMAHMDVEDPLVTTILNKIRDLAPSPQMPVQFVTGHTHYRGVSMVDDYSSSFEAGKFLDTVGFVSFPTKATAIEAAANGYPDYATPPSTPAPAPIEIGNSTTPSDSSNTTDSIVIESPTATTATSDNALFKYVFIEANRQALQATLGISNQEEFHTKDGKDLSNFIFKTQTKMGLLEVVGCADKDYNVYTDPDDEDSLWRLFREKVFPAWYQDEDRSSNVVMILPYDSWRFDIHSTVPLVMDDIFAVAPYNDTVVYMGTASGKEINRIQDMLVEGWSSRRRDPVHLQDTTKRLPDYFLMGTIDDENKRYMVYTTDFVADDISKMLRDQSSPSTDLESGGNHFEPEPMPYTTTIMWLSYVSSQWRCPGGGSNLPDWLPSPPKFVGQNGDQSSMEKAAIASIAILAVLFLCIVMTCFCLFFRYLCCSGHQSISQSELDAFKMGDSFDEEQDDIYNMDSNDHDENDHEADSPSDENGNELL